MSQASALLNSLSEEQTSQSTSPVNDFLLIDAEGRITNIPGTEILLGVETDHDVERKYFKCPRIVGDNIDLTTLTLRVHFQNANGDKDMYIIDDVAIDGKFITFSWLLSDKVLAAKGNVLFTVCAVSTDTDGNVKNKWNTTLASGNVLEGLIIEDLDDYEEEQARDVLTQLLQLLETRTDESVQKVQTEGTTQIGKVQTEAAEQMEAIEAKGAETLASIPEDYATIDANVKQNATDIYNLNRTKTVVISGEKTGEVIYVEDSAEQPPVSLQLFGKTEQTAYTNGYQLFDASKLVEKSIGGASLKNNGDGSFTLSGSGSLTDVFAHSVAYTHDETIKLLKVGILTCNFGATSYPNMYIQLIADGNIIATPTNRTSSIGTAEVTQDFLDNETSYLRVGFYGAVGETIVTGTMKPMLYQDGDGTWERFSGGKPGPNPEYPFEMESIESPKLVKLGKNLLRDSKIPAKSTFRGYTSEYEGDGVFHIYGTWDTASIDGGIQLSTTYLEIPTTPNDVYTLSAQLLEGSIPFRIHPYLGIGDETVDCKNWFSLWMTPDMKVGEIMSMTYSAGVPLTTATRIPRFWIYGYNETMEALTGDFRIKVWFEKGYSNTGYSVSEENEVELPYELRGIPVSSDGNVTDSNGQMWYGDEIDLVRGVIIQRLKEYIIDENTPIFLGSHSNGQLYYAVYPADIATGSIMYSSHYRNTAVNWSNDDGFIYCINKSVVITDSRFTSKEEGTSIISAETPTIMYMLAEPIEILLTDEEIAAYREVLMSYPITTLYNSANATMKLEYAKDTKTYLENEFESTLDEILAIQEVLIGGDA